MCGSKRGVCAEYNFFFFFLQGSTKKRTSIRERESAQIKEVQTRIWGRPVMAPVAKFLKLVLPRRFDNISRSNSGSQQSPLSLPYIYRPSSSNTRRPRRAYIRRFHSFARRADVYTHTHSDLTRPPPAKKQKKNGFLSVGSSLLMHHHAYLYPIPASPITTLTLRLDHTERERYIVYT